MAPMSEMTTPTGDPAATGSLAETAATAALESGPARSDRHSLWRHADYMKLWSAATISLMGSQVSLLAIPFIAAIILKSSPLEVALLGAVEMTPFILFALPAGAWLDRVRRRPVLVAGDFGRGLALLSIPIAYAAGVLTIWQLYAVGFTTGCLTVLFDVGDQSYLPALIEREDLVEGNAKLQLPQSAATILGPGIGGGLIGFAGAPYAIVADAISFFASGGLISLIRKPEPRPQRRVTESGSHMGMRQEIAEGLGYVLGNRYLRMIAGTTATCNLGTSMAFSIFAVFAYRELGLSALLVGIIGGAGGFGILLGALVSEGLSRRIGVGPAIVGSMFLTGPATFLYALDAVRRPDRRSAAVRIGLPERLHGRGLQRQPGQLPAGHHAAGDAGPDERHDALHRLGHDAGGKPDRRPGCVRPAASHDDPDRRGGVGRRLPLGALLSRSVAARDSERSPDDPGTPSRGPRLPFRPVSRGEPLGRTSRNG